MARSRGIRKSIFDPVHGQIAFTGPALALIGTSEFQRLWGIRQTGFAHLVFPGANHTRLEHSLGTYWIAQQMIERLEVPAASRALVEAGALLHDLGHGPFSHTVEPSMREVLGHGHERRSRDLIEGREEGHEGGEVPRILERAGVRPRDVADLVDPPPGSGNRGAGLLRSILHGPIDADRLDYLERDAHYTGVAHGAIDSARLLGTVQTVRGELAFAAKARHAVEGFLVGRSLMYSAVYYHKTVRAAELMAQAALERSQGYPGNGAQLLRGTDGDFLGSLGADPGSTSGRLVEGLRERVLYKLSYGWPRLDASTTRRWARISGDPATRRALEDELSARFRSPPGSVLFDLAGLRPRDPPEEDGRSIALVDGTKVSRPFNDTGPWHAFATGAPTPWRVVAYSTPALRRPLARWLERDPSRLPG